MADSRTCSICHRKLSLSRYDFFKNRFKNCSLKGSSLSCRCLTPTMSSDDVASPTAPASFGKLAPELRNRVYAYCFSAVPVLENEASFTLHQRTTEDARDWRFLKDAKHYSPDGDLEKAAEVVRSRATCFVAVGILLVNKKIYQEAHAIMVQSIRFVVHNSSHFDTRFPMRRPLYNDDYHHIDCSNYAFGEVFGRHRIYSHEQIDNCAMAIDNQYHGLCPPTFQNIRKLHLQIQNIRLGGTIQGGILRDLVCRAAPRMTELCIIFSEDQSDPIKSKRCRLEHVDRLPDALNKLLGIFDGLECEKDSQNFHNLQKFAIEMRHFGVNPVVSYGLPEVHYGPRKRTRKFQGNLVAIIRVIGEAWGKQADHPAFIARLRQIFGVTRPFHIIEEPMKEKEWRGFWKYRLEQLLSSQGDDIYEHTEALKLAVRP